MTPLLSVLLTAVPSRPYKLILDKLLLQASAYPQEVEILYRLDENTTSGVKRNELMAEARGVYFCYMDDDDDVADDYISQLVKGCLSGADVVTFNLSYTNGEKKELWRFGLEQNRRSIGIMQANHLCVTRASIGRKVKWVETFNYMIDHLWFEPLYAANLFQSQYHINRILYHYNFDATKTLAQRPNDVNKAKNYFKEGIKCYKDENNDIYLSVSEDTVRDSDNTIVPLTSLYNPVHYHTIHHSDIPIQKSRSVKAATPSKRTERPLRKIRTNRDSFPDAKA